MEYVFGTMSKRGHTYETLKTVGKEHTSLKGKHVIESKYPDSVVTDVFIVDSHYLSKDDIEGKCYDWYTISNHTRYIDYFTPVKATLEIGIADAQNATCELSEEIDTRISDIENALCELTEE